MALFQRPTPEKIRQLLQLTRYSPDLKLQTLSVGVDNIRYDVRLSPRLRAFSGPYVFGLFLKHSNGRRLLDEFIDPPSAADRTEFKHLVQEVLVGALSQARTQKNPEIDLLANLALFKYLAWEMQRQYGDILLQGKNKMKYFEGPRYVSNPRAAELQQAVNDFQTLRKFIFRLVAGELQRTVNEVQADAVRKTRESFFGPEAANWRQYFSNPLLYADNGRDDYTHLEKYVMVSNYNRDPDRFESIEDWLRGFLRQIDQAGPEPRELAALQQRQLRLAAKVEELRRAHIPGPKVRSTFGKLLGGGGPTPSTMPAAELSQTVADLSQQLLDLNEEARTLASAYDLTISDTMNSPENVDEMFGFAATELQMTETRKRGASTTALEEKIEIQKALADDLYESAEKNGLLPFMFAAYETARIFADFCPQINPQTLKLALLKSDERDKVAEMMRHLHMPESRFVALRDAAERVRTAPPRDLRQALLRFVGDYFRHHRDTRHSAVVQALCDRIHLLMDERTEQLSRINGTLHEFLISSEEQPVERKVIGHVILKADIRDSTRLTSELMARGLNPASYFSLNFFEPLNRILSRYGAEKVFIEGDAVILALFEQEGARGRAVALACGLAREMTEIVKLYNTKSEAGGLPKLETGIGITYRNNPPLYLLDGEDRIMISEALNLSDRLSGCSKLARKSLPDTKSVFNVFVLQTISEEAAAGAMEEFLVRYNVNGICLSEDAFEKLRSEISFSKLEVNMPLLWGKEKVILHSGAVPLSADVYQRLVVREATVPFVDPQSFTMKEPTKRRYFELCTSKVVYDYTDKMIAGGG
jgi:class 3 adenylate cyclase